MNTQHHRKAGCRTRLANAQELRDMLNREHSRDGLPKDSLVETPLPAQAPAFLKDLPAKGEVYEPVEPITQKLQQIITDNYYQSNFEDAITIVSKQKVPELENITNLSQFYYYVDSLVTWIPEIRVWDWEGEILHERTPYLRISQFYYYFNQPTLEALQSPIAPLEGQCLSPISEWLREFAVEWGNHLDTPASCEYLESFKYAPEYSWQDFEKPPENYSSFNAFFARTFKNMNEQRPVAQSDNKRVVVFPAESTFVGQWAVSTPAGAPLAAPPSIVVKHIEWSIQELLYDSEYASCFEGGLFCHSFLNTYDYHRMHTPVAGEVLEAKFISGQVYLQVNLEEQGKKVANSDLANAVIPQRHLDAKDPTGYQFVQNRGLIVLESPIGKVAILPMGMAQVSSVVFVDPDENPITLSKEEKKELNYDQQVELINKKIAAALTGKTYDKGQMFSYFQFGGSDCVMVFERKANISITAEVGVHYPIRTQCAIANINL